jgi:hypothetical protein
LAYIFQKARDQWLCTQTFLSTNPFLLGAVVRCARYAALLMPVLTRAAALTRNRDIIISPHRLIGRNEALSKASWHHLHSRRSLRQWVKLECAGVWRGLRLVQNRLR